MQVTLIVLFAYWCPKCNMMMPVVDEIEEVYKEQLEVVRIEVMRMAGIIGEEILKKRIEAVIGK